MAHGPMTNGLAAVPLPLVTQPQLAKSAFELMVIAACPPVPAEPGAREGEQDPGRQGGQQHKQPSHMGAPLHPVPEFSRPHLLIDRT